MSEEQWAPDLKVDKLKTQCDRLSRVIEDQMLELERNRVGIARLKAELTDAQKEIDEMQEPMSCGHAQAEMQPSDEGPDMCIACYLQQELQAKSERMEKALRKYAGPLGWIFGPDIAKEALGEE